MDEIGQEILSIERIKEGRTNETYLVQGNDKKYIARMIET